MPRLSRGVCRVSGLNILKGSGTSGRDAKNRFAIPSGMRPFLREAGDGKAFSIALADDKPCAMAFRADHIETMLARVEREAAEALERRLPYDRDMKLTNLFGTLDDVLIDTAGRFSLPASVRDHCEITDGILFIGVVDYIQIWSVDKVLEQPGLSNALKDAARRFIEQRGAAQ